MRSWRLQEITDEENCFVRQLFVVVNKVDMLARAEQVEVFDYIQTRLRQLLGTGAMPLYPLSARESLAAKEPRC